eukprot:TRINITY_DN10771_c0_g1_i2.p1 TRINITY_DN10771_c0_g1~~TRINITY_DN10771_c0_g1_i2.p1  ORF type:complete len:286 (-),score=-19.87 TRINITY_DN10771_c0_g1_i2:54-788(-)
MVKNNKNIEQIQILFLQDWLKENTSNPRLERNTIQHNVYNFLLKSLMYEKYTKIFISYQKIFTTTAPCTQRSYKCNEYLTQISFINQFQIVNLTNKHFYPSLQNTKVFNKEQYWAPQQYFVYMTNLKLTLSPQLSIFAHIYCLKCELNYSPLAHGEQKRAILSQQFVYELIASLRAKYGLTFQQLSASLYITNIIIPVLSLIASLLRAHISYYEYNAKIFCLDSAIAFRVKVSGYRFQGLYFSR